MARSYTKTDAHVAAVAARGPRGSYGPRGKKGLTAKDKARFAKYKEKEQAAIRVAELYNIPLDRPGHLGDRVRRTMMVRILRGMRLAMGCSICGYNKCARALHFHHRDRSTKKFSVSARASQTNNTWESILAEVDKCDVLCANHHYELEDEIDSSNPRDLTGKVVLPE